MSLRITGMGAGIPAKSVTNHELSGFLDTSDEWIRSKTGIVSRRLSTGETLTDLAETAARRAIENSDVSAGDIDLIICSTIGGDYLTPSLAACLSERLGVKCAAFDINAACTGFIYALDIAVLYLNGGRAGNVLIVCAEMMSRHVDWSDRSVCVLFGDGAAACVASAGGALRYMRVGCDGNVKILNRPSDAGNSPFASGTRGGAFLHMDGPEVYRFAVGAVEDEAGRMLEATGMSCEDVDYFVLHQANKRIIDSVRLRMRQPEEKFPVNIGSCGNMSSVSIPLLLSEMLEDGRLTAGKTLFLCAFGAGLTTGGCTIVWE